MPSRPYKFSRAGAHPPVRIDYTSRDFTSIRRDILQYANIDTLLNFILNLSNSNSNSYFIL